MQKCPKFRKVILYWRSGQYQTVFSFQALKRFRNKTKIVSVTYQRCYE
jgi:hypothetical protein